VAETSDGQEAIALTRKFKPNALLLDLATTRAFQLGARGVVAQGVAPGPPFAKHSLVCEGEY